MRGPGIEPGPSPWKGKIITTRPPTHNITIKKPVLNFAQTLRAGSTLGAGFEDFNLARVEVAADPKSACTASRFDARSRIRRLQPRKS